MKKSNRLIKIIITLLSMVHMLSIAVPASAQYKKVYTVKVENNRGGYGIPNARITIRGKEYLTTEQGLAVFGDDVTNQISVSAAGYKTRELRLDPPGRLQVIGLAEIKEEFPLHAYIKDNMNRPLAGVEVNPAPGRGEVTDKSGYARAIHMQVPGEYIKVTLIKKGYKTKVERVLVGVGQGNALSRPEDYANFVMEEDDGVRSLVNLMVEVLDYNTNEPVNGANVQLKLPAGQPSGSTNADGKVEFVNIKTGKGERGRIIVKHSKYEDKWTDIEDDMLEAVEGNRNFVVHLKKKADPSIAGKYDITWTDPYATYIFQWDVRPSGTGYQVWHKMISTTHGFNQSLVGQSWEDITLTPNGNGTFELTRTSTDANPGNPGFFMQTATCEVGKGGISCEGTHKGTQITHWIKIKGSKLRE